MLDGDNYVAKSPDLGVMMRGHNLDDLRRACCWLQWDVEDLENSPEQLPVEAQNDRIRRRVSIEPDGDDDYVVKSQDLGVMMRHHDLDDLRKACRWLQWDIEEGGNLPPQPGA
jgi:hypothetical protein